MTRKLHCTGCGKSVPVGPEDAGRRALCSACGRAVEVPEAIESLPVWKKRSEGTEGEGTGARRHEGTEGEVTHHSSLITHHSFTPTQASARSTQHSPDPRPHRARGAMLGLGIALGVCVAVAAMLVVGAWPADGRWEEEVGPRLVAMKEEAQLLEGEGKLVEAHEVYRRLLAEVGGREARGPELRAALEAARRRQEEIYGMLIQRQREAWQAPAVAAVQAEQPKEAPANPRAARPTTRPVDVAPTPIVKPPVVVEPPVVVRPAVAEPARAVPNRPPTRRIPVERAMGDVTDEEIGRAVERGSRYLLGQFQDGQLTARVVQDDSYTVGLNALCVYALLQCGQTIYSEQLNYRTEPLAGMIGRVRDAPINGRYETYALGLRATMLAVHNRPADRVQLKADVERLMRAHRSGGYTYRASPGAAAQSGVRSYDNSNSQYGLLGVWSGAEAGVEVPASYWNNVQNHWFESQYQSGEWGYTGPRQSGGTLAMTVAGLASLFVTHDYLDAMRPGSGVGREPFSIPLARGLAWMEEGDNSLRLSSNAGYTLYGIERVGLASGFKYFGRHDWYRTLARRLIDDQSRDGSWGGGRGMMRGRGQTGDLVETAYNLLFLARGRHPVLMNKLRFDGHWANRSRDVANLARYASRELERPINWQVVTMERDWHDWMDSPILYIASHAPIDLKDADRTKLRKFVEAGGLIYTQADGRSEAFNRFVVELGASLFPDYEWRDLPHDHVIYTLNFQVTPRPPLRYLTNGSRVLMLHSPNDIARHWQVRAERTQQNLFHLGLNLFIYGAGKADLRNRLSSPYIPPVRGHAGHRVRLARLRYSLQWNPEPYAFERFGNWFERQTGYELSVRTVDLANLTRDDAPIAHLTGAAPYTPSDAELRAMREYVQAGGTLIIDACGGSASFAESVRNAILDGAFGDGAEFIATPQHPLLAGKGDGMDVLPRLLMRTYAEVNLGRAAARIHVLEHGKGRVIFSPLDITTGLLGTNTWDVLGYRPVHAQSLMKNAILWTLDGAPME